MKPKPPKITHDDITWITLGGVAALYGVGKIKRQTAMEVLVAIGATDAEANGLLDGFARTEQNRQAEGLH